MAHSIARRPEQQSIHVLKNLAIEAAAAAAALVMRRNEMRCILEVLITCPRQGTPSCLRIRVRTYTRTHTHTHRRKTNSHLAVYWRNSYYSFHFTHESSRGQKVCLTV